MDLSIADVGPDSEDDVDVSDGNNTDEDRDEKNSSDEENDDNGDADRDQGDGENDLESDESDDDEEIALASLIGEEDDDSSNDDSTGDDGSDGSDGNDERAIDQSESPSSPPEPTEPSKKGAQSSKAVGEKKGKGSASDTASSKVEESTEAMVENTELTDSGHASPEPLSLNVNLVVPKRKKTLRKKGALVRFDQLPGFQEKDSDDDTNAEYRGDSNKDGAAAAVAAAVDSVPAHFTLVFFLSEHPIARRGVIVVSILQLCTSAISF